MSKTKWTPGPWVAKRNGVYRWVECANWTVCVFYEFREDGSVPEADNAESNARLISAAPDMAEALEKLVAWENTIEAYIPHGALMDAFKAARAALAKARGEE